MDLIGMLSGIFLIVLGGAVALLVSREAPADTGGRGGHRGESQPLAQQVLPLTGFGLWSIAFVCFGVLVLRHPHVSHGTVSIPSFGPEPDPLLLVAAMVGTLGGFGVLAASVLRGELAHHQPGDD